MNSPINRRKALKVMGLGVLATCVPPITSCGNANKEKKIKRLIFYFSATGNSLYISRQIAGEEGTLLSISQEIHNDNPVYEAEEIGFVCPIYCFIPPAIVQDFIARSTFKADYFFAVGTFGAHSTIFPEFMNNLAKENDIEMNYISSIQMVDTYLPFFDIERELADPKIQRIPERLAVILASINSRENYIQPVTEQDRMMCEGVCPHGSWKLVDGHGVPEGDCETCLACVHNCPQKAISIIPTPPEPEEANRNARYRHPNVTIADLIRANSQAAL